MGGHGVPHPVGALAYATVAAVNTDEKSDARRHKRALAHTRIRRGTRAVGRVAFGPIVKTVIAAFAMFVYLPFYASLIATYAQFFQAIIVGAGLLIFTALGVLLWPTRTSPWRTLIWAFLASTAVGAILLAAGAYTFALTAATVTGFAVTLLRINQNGRKLASLISTWRALR